MLSWNIPLQKLFGCFRRLQMWTTGDWQLHLDNMPAHASCLMQTFWVKHKITQVTQRPLQTRFGTLWLLDFPKMRITFEGEEISDYWWDSGKYSGAAYGNWENHGRSWGAYIEEDWDIIVLCTMFLISYTFFNKYPYFTYYMAGYLLDKPHISTYIIYVYYICTHIYIYNICICVHYI